MFKKLVLLLCLYSVYLEAQDEAQGDPSLKIEEEALSEDADWDSFENELEGGLEEAAAPSKVPESTDKTAAEPSTPPASSPSIENTPSSASPSSTEVSSNTSATEESDTFDLGPEENELIQLSQVLSTQISDEEWRTITQSSSTTTYIVKNNDWLFKISKNLFGSGLYYPKIWSMNPHITNPHEIEPGMQLVFDPGSAILPPSLSVEQIAAGENSVMSSIGTPRWFEEKKKLMAKGIEVISSDEELAKVMGSPEKNEEYKKYVPPQMEIVSKPPADQYDSFGIDKGNVAKGEFKQGHYLNTFVTTNEIKEVGEFTDMPTEAISFNLGFKIFITLNEGQNAQAGDLYSIYTDHGKVESDKSERTGRKYVVNGAVKLLQQVDVENRKWEAVVTEIFVAATRGAKLTSYTPKIDKVFKTYNSRMIEGTIFSGYREFNNHFTTGDIVYVDRGRADGVEVGNVFDVYDSKDRGEGRIIASKPVYRTGELTIISVTDNFATAQVSNGLMDFGIGDIVRTRSSEEEQVARSNLKPKVPGVEIKDYTSKSIGDDIYEKVKNTNLSPQELAELERQQAQKDILDETERDLKELEDLENTISQADQLLSTQNNQENIASKDLEDIEGQVYQQGLKVNLDSLEERYGKKYLDEDLKSVDNPFGLSQYDVEEVDELLNMQKTNDIKQDKVESESSAPVRKKYKR
jgi:hypothetical protein